MSKASCSIKIAILVILTLTLLMRFNCKITYRKRVKAFVPQPNSRESADSGISVVVSSRLCTSAANHLIPFIGQNAVNYTFPRQQVDYITIDPMKMDTFNFTAFDFRFAFPDSKNFTLGVIDVALSIPNTRFKFQYGFFTCTGIFSISLNETSVYLNIMPYILQNNSLKLEFGEAHINWGSMEIHHKNDGFICNVEESIARLFLGEIDQCAEKNVRKRLPKILASELQTRADQLLWTIPSHFLNLEMTKDQLFVDVDVLPDHPVGRKNPSRAYISLLSSHLRRAKPPWRDIMLVLPAVSINHYLERAQRRNFLNTTYLFPSGIDTTIIQYFFPEAYHLCPNCGLAVRMAPAKGPLVNFSAHKYDNVHVYNNSIEVFIREEEVSFLMLPDTPQKAAEILQMIQSKPTKEKPPSRPLEGPARGMPGQTHFVLHHDNNLKGLEMKNITNTSLNSIPIVVFSVSYVAGVGNMRFGGPQRNELSFDFMPLRDLNIMLLETNIGSIDTKKLEKEVLKFVNFLLIPMVETRDWLKLPITEGIIKLESENLIVGANISSGSIFNAYIEVLS